MTRFSYELQTQNIGLSDFCRRMKERGAPVSYETARRWKAGLYQISSAYLPHVAKVLGVSIEALLAPVEIIISE